MSAELKTFLVDAEFSGRIGINSLADSVNFPVQGMEKVLATVSGYHGSERFNIIRLISRIGASYVGNMNKCTTHLVCWKFEGKKYELAKKLKIAIVNHCWIEECVRQGRRVSEEPYSFQCGEEMGPLRLDYLSVISMAKGKSQLVNRHKEQVIDIECEDTNNDDWTDPILFSQRHSRASKRSIRKSIRQSSSKDHPISSNHCLETLSRPTTVELQEASISVPADSCRLRKRVFTSLECRSKGRRLVKKHTSVDDLTLDDCEEVEVLPCSNGSGILSPNAGVEWHQNSSGRNTSDMRCSLSGQDDPDAHDNDEIENVNEENQNTCAPGASTSLPTTAEAFEKDAYEDFIDNNPANRLPASSELSCVICWTDFSSTRGVLPCGHRFCFSCIQNWADHMASRKKSSTCPLCKASFICITKVDDAISSDQKIYSQTIPSDSSNKNLYILPDETHGPPSNPSEATCCRCFSREPEDLLIRCHFCQIRCVHSYCLDPPLLPWTCVRCKDLQMLYLHSR